LRKIYSIIIYKKAAEEATQDSRELTLVLKYFYVIRCMREDLFSYNCTMRYVFRNDFLRRLW